MHNTTTITIVVVPCWKWVQKGIWTAFPSVVKHKVKTTLQKHLSYISAVADLTGALLLSPSPKPCFPIRNSAYNCNVELGGGKIYRLFSPFMVRISFCDHREEGYNPSKSPECTRTSPKAKILVYIL